MYYKGYWGDRQMIRLSDLTFTGQYKYNSQSPYTYNNSYPNNLMGAQWSGSMYYATNNASEPMGDFTLSTLKTTAGISTSGNGYIHGTASMNGITLWASATSSNSTGINKSRIFKTTDGGVNWTIISSSINGTSRQYTINSIPNVVTDKAKIRISRNGMYDSSDDNFSIIRFSTIPNFIFEE